MIAIKLREAFEVYRRETGTRLTYELLAQMTGLSFGYLKIIGSQPHANPTLEVIEKICRALGTTPGELLELVDDPPKAKRAVKKKGGG